MSESEISVGKSRYVELRISTGAAWVLAAGLALAALLHGGVYEFHPLSAGSSVGSPYLAYNKFTGYRSNPY